MYILEGEDVTHRNSVKFLMGHFIQWNHVAGTLLHYSMVPYFNKYFMRGEMVLCFYCIISDVANRLSYGINYFTAPPAVLIIFNVWLRV